MKELQRRQYIKKLLYSFPSLFIVAVLTFLLAKGAFNILMIERSSAGRVKELELEAQVLAHRQEELKNDIDNLQTEEGIIEEIKRKFSVTREGEHVAIIVDERNKATSTNPMEEIWYRRWWNAIMRK